MPIETNDLVIDGVTYRISKIGAFTGQKILFRIGQALAAGIASGNVMRMITHLSTEDLDWITRLLAPTTKVGIVDTEGDGRVTFVGLDTVYDRHFAGNYGAAFKWLKGALDTNFVAFFDDVQSLVGGLAGASSSPSPKAVPGTSGASSSAPT